MKTNIKTLIVILSTGLLLSACTKSASTASSATTPQNPQAATSKTMTGTLQSLLTGGSAQQCTFSNTTANATVNGTMLIAKGKVKGDITTVTPNATIVSHVILDQPTMYIWSDQSNQGVKMAIPSAAPTASPLASPTTANGAPNMNQQYTYTCRDWAEDDTVFAVPTGVTFTDFAVKSPAASGMAAPSGNSAVHGMHQFPY